MYEEHDGGEVMAGENMNRQSEVEHFPKISCIVPVYNVEKYLRRCVDSILAQTFMDFELILVDDGSPDGCPAICDEYAEKDRRVKVVHKENGGPASARNAGLEIATGDFFYFCDSDDWCDSNLLEAFVNAQRDTDADIVGCDLVREYGYRKEIFPIPLKETSDENLKYLLLGTIPGWMPVKFIRASLFQNDDCCWRNGINICEDLLLSAKLFFYAKKFSYVPKVLYHYECLNENSLTALLSEEKVFQIFRAHGEVKCFLESKGVLEKYMEELDYAELSNINWTLLFCKKQKLKYFKLLSSKKFYKNKYASFPLKIYLFLGYFKIYPVIFLIVQIKRFMLPKR